MRRNRSIFLIGAAMGGLFLCGVWYFFELRFSAGDIYPPYSSLRADPLGTRVFYTALGTFPNLEVGRNLDPIHQLDPSSRPTLFYVGIPSPLLMRQKSTEAQGEDFTDMESALFPWFDDLDLFVRSGGRLFISFAPLTMSPEEEEVEAEEQDKEDKDSNKDKAKYEKKTRKRRKKPSETPSWGMVFNSASLHDLTPPFPAALSAGHEAHALPPSIPCDNLLYFDRLTPQWRTLYSCQNHPVLIARKLGRGKVILSASSYFLSNEAMMKERQTSLLSWLVGDSKKVIFDEAHFAIEHHPGLVSLARKYHLEGLGAALALLTALFIWSGKALIPPSSPLPKGQTLQTSLGRDEAAGFINLLRRNIPAKNLLSLCHQEWNKAFSRSTAIPAPKRKEIEETMAMENKASSRAKNPVATYNHICQILAKRNP